jgi:hypothetical protein
VQEERKAGRRTFTHDHSLDRNTDTSAKRAHDARAPEYDVSEPRRHRRGDGRERHDEGTSDGIIASVITA